MPNSLPTRLNPFENQVYFYIPSDSADISYCCCLNPPFENQVYFYIPSDSADISYCCCLNPFENQVYFYLVNTGYYHNLDFLS